MTHYAPLTPRNPFREPPQERMVQEPLKITRGRKKIPEETKQENRRKRQAEYYQKNKEHVLARQKRWKEANRDRVRENDRRHRLKRKENPALKQRDKEYWLQCYQDNRELIGAEKI